MRKGSHEAVYRCGGSRIRLLLRSAPECVPDHEVSDLGFKSILDNTVYAVRFKDSVDGISRRHLYPLAEIVRIEETEVGVDNPRDGAAAGCGGGGCEYRDGEKSLVVLARTDAPEPEVSGEVGDLDTLEQFGGRLLVVRFTRGGLRRWHKYPVADIASVRSAGVPHKDS